MSVFRVAFRIALWLLALAPRLHKRLDGARWWNLVGKCGDGPSASSVGPRSSVFGSSVLPQGAATPLGRERFQCAREADTSLLFCAEFW